MAYILLFTLGGGLLIAAALWLVLVQRRLAALRSDMERAGRELTMHRALSKQNQGGPDEAAAREMLDTSRMLYRVSMTAYNLALQKPLMRLPACILGYRPATEGREA